MLILSNNYYRANPSRFYDIEEGEAINERDIINEEEEGDNKEGDTSPKETGVDQQTDSDLKLVEHAFY